MHLLGYTDPLVVHPGGEVRVMVSSEFDSYESQVVRLIHGDTSPESPGFKAEPVATSADGTHPGRIQETHAGSYVDGALNHPRSPAASRLPPGSGRRSPRPGPFRPSWRTAAAPPVTASDSVVPRGMPTGPDTDSAGCTIPPEGTRTTGSPCGSAARQFSLGVWPVARSAGTSWRDPGTPPRARLVLLQQDPRAGRRSPRSSATTDLGTLDERYAVDPTPERRGHAAAA